MILLICGTVLLVNFPTALSCKETGAFHDRDSREGKSRHETAQGNIGRRTRS